MGDGWLVTGSEGEREVEGEESVKKEGKEGDVSDARRTESLA